MINTFGLYPIHNSINLLILNTDEAILLKQFIQIIN